MENTYSSSSTDNQPKKVKKILTTIAIVLGAITLFKMAFPSTQISVTGLGELSTKVNKVSMIVTKTNTSPLAANAIQTGEEGLNALIKEAKTIVGEEAEIQKSFYTISQNSGQQVVGTQLVTVSNFQVSNGFKITFNQIDKVNDLVKTLYTSGATSISNITFLPENEDEIEKEVRKLALKNARQEGRKIAASMGRILGRIKTVADDQAEISSTISSSQDSVGSGEMDISKSVSVVYELW
ncbi:MAG: SIMPL domain-containing protein [Candidatus Shapirobacteria bacterium]|nr:SIMPL domain-containing protein [Candidatus Shapirobacteria bacterium]